MKKLLSLVIVLCLVSTLSFAGVVDARFTNITASADNYCVDVQIKAQDIAFEIGSATIFFEYNIDAVQNPTSTPINFSETNTCAYDGNIAPYKNSFNFLQSSNKGEGNYAILLTIPDAGCPTITNDTWIDVATFCFEVVDATAAPNLSFNTSYTAFNTVDNTGNQHQLGNLDATTGIEDAVTSSDMGVSIYPNYTKDIVTISCNFTTNKEVSITAYDMLGRSVYNTSTSINAGGQTESINLEKFGMGYYLIEVDNGSEKISEKILLTK